MRRVTSLFVLLALAVALGTTAIALAAGKAKPTVTIKASPRTQAFNLPATITGFVRGGVPGIQSVSLQSSATRQGHFVTIKQRNATVIRSYTFTVKPSQNTFYRVVSGGTTTPVVPLFRDYAAVVTCNVCPSWHGKRGTRSEPIVVYFSLRVPDQVNLSGRPLSFYFAKNPAEKRMSRVGTIVIHQAPTSRVVRLHFAIARPAGLGVFAYSTCFPDRPKVDHMLPPEGQVAVCGASRARLH
jgi:hypothetical protein